MGLSASKRVKATLSNSGEFDSACDSSFTHCLALTQHAFQGVLPYQLLTASDHLHHSLSSSSSSHSLIRKWVPSPPSRTQVDSALRAITTRRRPNKNNDLSAQEEELLEVLGPAQFKEWALVLFSEAVVGNAGKAVMRRVPIGIAGIAGIGVVTRSGRDLVGTAIGVYAIGVATSIYLSLSG